MGHSRLAVGQAHEHHQPNSIPPGSGTRCPAGGTRRYLGRRGTGGPPTAHPLLPYIWISCRRAHVPASEDPHHDVSQQHLRPDAVCADKLSHPRRAMHRYPRGQPGRLVHDCAHPSQKCISVPKLHTVPHAGGNAGVGRTSRS